MDKDKEYIFPVLRELLTNSRQLESPIAEAAKLIEDYVEGERAKAIGWCHADMCIALADDIDPRSMEVPKIFERAKKDLAK